jgi:hypothetical protein
MRKGFLGSIAALAAGAGAAWGQPPAPTGAPGTGPGAPPVPAGVGTVTPPAPPPTVWGQPQFGGFPANAIPGNAGFPPPPMVMPPGNFGPPYDPLGMGPPGGFGPPPGPMYPTPGPYGSPLYQPAPPTPTVLGPGGPDGQGRGLLNRDLGYGCAPHWWWEGEYLMWFTKGQNVRFPLLTTSAPSDAGLLGAASTTVLVGDRSLGYNMINGLRIGTGFFGDEDRRFGFQMYGFILERASNIRQYGNFANVSGIPVLARPFIDTTTGFQNTLVLSGPDFGPAQVIVGTNSQLWGITPEGVWNLYRTHPGTRLVWSVDLTAGYRYLNLKEELFVDSRTQLASMSALPVFVPGPFGTAIPLPAVVAPAMTTLGGTSVMGPAAIEIRDRITAVNQFNGAVFGLQGNARYGMITSSLFGKIAMGNMHERVIISGASAFFDPTGRSGSNANTFGAAALGVGGGAGSAFGGLLANSGNIGTHVHDRFTFIPEFGGNIGIALTRGLTGYIGGNFMYFPNVVRPGNLVNPVISAASIPFSASYGAQGATRNQGFQFVETDHWVGGLSVGLILKY